MPAPAVYPNPAAGAVLNFRSIVQTRSTTMLRGIAIALFGMCIFSQLDRALMYGRNTDAALRLMREIAAGLGCRVSRAALAAHDDGNFFNSIPTVRAIRLSELA